MSDAEPSPPQIKMQGRSCIIHPYIRADEFLESPSENGVFGYNAQRWLWNEPDQLRRRYLEFDLKALIRVAENAVGSDANCVEVTTLPEGNFNKTFLVTMHDEHQLIARLPNPNAGRAHYTTASEVATMDFVCPSYAPQNSRLNYLLTCRLGQRSSPDSCPESHRI
jgi:hypothetical protein